MSSEPAPETIIREFMLHAIEQGDAADNDTTWEASVVAALDALVRERDEARAEIERQRIRYGSLLDWAIGVVVVAVEADEEVGRPWLERMEHRLREERAALAAAQEPPAECRHTNWRVEFRSPARGQVRPDPITYGQWVVCIDCGHERRGSVPPAKGGDR